MKAFIFLGVSLFTVAACQKEQPASDNKGVAQFSEVAEKSSNTKPSSDRSLKQATNPKDDTSSIAFSIHFNGFYHSLVDTDGSEVIIVNKKYPLSPEYAPGEDKAALSAFMQL